MLLQKSYPSSLPWSAAQRTRISEGKPQQELHAFTNAACIHCCGIRASPPWSAAHHTDNRSQRTSLCPDGYRPSSVATGAKTYGVELLSPRLGWHAAQHIYWTSVWILWCSSPQTDACHQHLMSCFFTGMACSACSFCCSSYCVPGASVGIGRTHPRDYIDYNFLGARC